MGKLSFFIIFCVYSNFLLSQEHKDILINDKENNTGFELLSGSIANKKYFFTGENHIYQKSNYLIQYKLTEYLHKNAGLNRILLEFGAGTGWLIDQYITTGESEYFEELKKYFSAENLALYEDLFELNKKNPGYPIHCHGIDLERFPQISIAALYFMLPEEAPKNDSLSISVETLRAIYSVADDYTNSDFYSANPGIIGEVEIYQTFELWLSDYPRLKEDYREYLGEDFDSFDKTIEGLIAGKKWYKLKDQRTLQETIFREQFMFTALKNLDTQFPDSKFYGQFGRCHIRTDNSSAQCYSYAMKSLIYKINESDKSDQLMIIPIFYVRNLFLKDKKFIENIIDDFWGTDEAVYLVKVPKDVKISNEFKDKTDFILINNLKLTKDQFAKDPYRTENQKKKIPSLRFSSEVEMGISFFNFTDLNSSLSAKGLPGFKSQIPTIGGIFSVFSPYGFYYGMEFAIGLSQRVNNDSTTLKLNSYNIIVNIGTSLLNTSWFSFNPSIGIGGGNFSLKEQKIISDPNSANLFSENYTNYTIYKNPSLLLDFKGELKFNIKIFSISFRGGYLLDVTNKRWKNPELLTNSPKTAMMGWHVRAGLGINLKVY
ncbi:MAG: hypothetical protein KDC84_12260 [Crocinitomicaceae bacterium]|nr:hypothetical protein [Crocinitomicaceae bacterium]